MLRLDNHHSRGHQRFYADRVEKGEVNVIPLPSNFIRSVPEGSWFIHSFGIWPQEERGKGYGSQMMGDVVAKFGKRYDLCLDVAKTNVPALKIYTKHGFKIVDSGDSIYIMYRPKGGQQ